MSSILLQKLLELPEHKKRAGGLVNNNLALQIKNATFAWEINNIDFKSKSGPPGSAKGKNKPGNFLFFYFFFTPDTNE